MSSRALRDYGLVVTLSLIWGSSFLLIKVAIDEVPPVTMAAVRVVIAFAVLYLLVRLGGQSLAPPWGAGGRVRWGHYLVIGMLGNGIPFSLVSWGEIEITAALAAILIGVMPVFTVIFAHGFGVERVTGPGRLAGIAAGLAGLVVLMGPAALTEMGGAALHELALIGAAACYAATAVYARRLTLRLALVPLAAGSMAASAMVMVPAALILETPWRLSPGLGAGSAVAALGVIATGFASIIYFRLLASTGPTFAATINYLIPVFGAGLSVVLLGEQVGPREVLALVLILSGIALVRSPLSR
ncbi:MAG: EamA family transporter [Alphaproteobacteria bacterium]|nr:EamA family transporter [Pseudomonadota bacterium]TDI65091.1 MAG: EamA family transporter [Alphaproteobacteria bacterium]